jgi:hypothetical protein
MATITANPTGDTSPTRKGLIVHPGHLRYTETAPVLMSNNGRKPILKEFLLLLNDPAEGRKLKDPAYWISGMDGPKVSDHYMIGHGGELTAVTYELYMKLPPDQRANVQMVMKRNGNMPGPMLVQVHDPDKIGRANYTQRLTIIGGLGDMENSPIVASLAYLPLEAGHWEETTSPVKIRT